MNLPDIVKSLSGSKYYQNVLIVFTKILIAKSHGTDVKRLTSTNNIIISLIGRLLAFKVRIIIYTYT